MPRSGVDCWYGKQIGEPVADLSELLDEVDVDAMWDKYLHSVPLSDQEASEVWYLVHQFKDERTKRIVYLSNILAKELARGERCGVCGAISMHAALRSVDMSNMMRGRYRNPCQCPDCDETRTCRVDDKREVTAEIEEEIMYVNGEDWDAIQAALAEPPEVVSGLVDLLERASVFRDGRDECG